MNRKMIVGIGLLVGIAAIAFSAAPIQARFDGADNGDMLQTQEQERLRAQNGCCNDECTQTQCNCTKNTREYRNQNREKTDLGD